MNCLLWRLLRGDAQASRFQRDVLTTFAAQVCTLLISLVSTSVLARSLGPQGRGQVVLALTVPTLLVVMLSLGTGVANVFYSGTGQFGRMTLAANTVAVMLASTAISLSLAVLLVGTGLIQRALPGLGLELLVLAGVLLPIGLLDGGLSGILQGMQRIRTLNLIALARALTNLAAAVLFVVFLGAGVAGAILASVLAGTLAVCLLFIALDIPVRALLPRWEKPVMRAIVSFGLRGQLGNVFQFLNYRLDTFIVNHYQGAASVGLYSAGVSLAELLWQLPSAIGFVIFPKAASSSREVMNQFTPRVFRATLVLTLAGAVGLAIIGRPVIRLLYSTAFLSAYEPMLLLLPGVVLLGAGKVVANELAGRGRPFVNSANAAVSLIVTVALDLVLIPRYGINGAAAASAISYSATFLVAVACFLVASGHTLSSLFCPARAEPLGIRRLLSEDPDRLNSPRGGNR